MRASVIKMEVKDLFVPEASQLAQHSKTNEVCGFPVFCDQTIHASLRLWCAQDQEREERENLKRLVLQYEDANYAAEQQRIEQVSGVR